MSESAARVKAIVPHTHIKACRSVSDFHFYAPRLCRSIGRRLDRHTNTAHSYLGPRFPDRFGWLVTVRPSWRTTYCPADPRTRGTLRDPSGHTSGAFQAT